MKQYFMSPSQTLLTSFGLLIGMGTLLLMLPFASVNQTWLPFIDALFTATSAATTTGLVVVDTGSYFSFFGQLVIMFLIQIGGLGYMIFIAIAILGLGGKLSLVDKLILNESIAHPSSLNIKKFVKIVIVLTLSFELIGAGLLTLFWLKDFPLGQAIYYGVFHSVSAFCTAGFVLFSDSFIEWRGDLGLNLVIIVLSLAGAIGFFVHYDVYTVIKARLNKNFIYGFSAYTKMVVMITGGLIGWATIMMMAGTWPEAYSLKERMLASIFQSVSASTTTGFNTVDIAVLAPISLLAIIFLMFIGASSGGTGGGIKTSTVGVLALFVLSFLRGEEDVQFFKRRLPDTLILRAVAILLIMLAWLAMTLMILLLTEKGTFLQLVFEMTAAVSSGGLSMGITSSLSPGGKFLMVLTMLVGRVGPLAIGYSLLGKIKPTHYRNATAEMLVG